MAIKDFAEHSSQGRRSIKPGGEVGMSVSRDVLRDDLSAFDGLADLIGESELQSGFIGSDVIFLLPVLQLALRVNESIHPVCKNFWCDAGREGMQNSGVDAARVGKSESRSVCVVGDDVVNFAIGMGLRVCEGVSHEFLIGNAHEGGQ